MNWSINNKAIKSLSKNNKQIVKIEDTKNNKIIYQLENGPKTVTLSCSTPIIEKGEQTTVIATYTQNGRPLVNELLNYYINSRSHSIADTTYTDDNGQISIPYTGSGDGIVEVGVEREGELPVIINITDALFYDNGRVDHKNTNWSKTNALSVSVGEDGTTITASSNAEYITTKTIEGDFKISLDTFGTGVKVRLGLKDNNGKYSRITPPAVDKKIYYFLKRQGGELSARYSYDGKTWTNKTTEVDEADDEVKFVFSAFNVTEPRVLTFCDLIIEKL